MLLTNSHLMQVWERLHGFFLRALTKQAITYFHDLIIVAVSLVIAMQLRVGAVMLDFTPGIIAAIVISVVLAAIVFPIVGLNRGIWRYASIPDLLAICAATSVTSILLIVAIFLIGHPPIIPRSVPAIAWFIQVILLSAPRIFIRFLKEHRRAARNRRAPAAEAYLLLGEHDQVVSFIRAVDRSKARGLVIGILDDRVKNQGRVILGVPIVGTPDDLPAVFAALEATSVRPTTVVVVGDVERVIVRTVVEQAARLGLKVARAPDPTRLREARSGEMALKPIQLEDLLGRKAYSLQTLSIRKMIENKRVLITGAGGSIGSELCRQIAQYRPAQMTMVDACEFNLYTIDQEIGELVPALSREAIICSVAHRDHVSRVMHQARPELVFHAAALKHVPLVEANPCEGVMTNVIGTMNVADAARDVGTKAFIQISTDKAVNPTNVMGATKRIAEHYCQSLDLRRGDTRFMTVRFGNVLGSTGSVVPLFERQLSRGGPITVTHPDIRRYFMTINEAVALVLQASVYGLNEPDSAGRIFVLDMGEPIRIVDLAHNMIRLAGLEPEVDVKVEIVGLRPGEKLFEELFSNTEPPCPTELDGVLVADCRAIDLSILRRLCRELEEAAAAGSVERVRGQIGVIVPEFRQTGPAEQVSS